ncbi:MAG: hypothetical protein ACLRXQ_11000 [Phascolarctobacterium faecium]
MTIIVENLFLMFRPGVNFYVLYRLKAIYISELITKLALSRPDVRFKLVSNDKEVLVRRVTEI